MKKIPLTQGKFTIVDDEDFEWLNQWKWYYNNGYAVRGVWNRNKCAMDMTLMHREILKTPRGFETDHINMNRLDNRKKNLRAVTASINQFNRPKPKNNKSGFKGVSWKSLRKIWEASITINGNYQYLGHFENKVDAAKAYNKVALKYFGELAFLNKI